MRHKALISLFTPLKRMSHGVAYSSSHRYYILRGFYFDMYINNLRGYVKLWLLCFYFKKNKYQIIDEESVGILAK